MVQMAIDSSTEGVPLPPSIYLDGCAWGCGFYAGVQKVFERLWGADFGTRTVMQGDSAGALIALGWSLGLPASFSQNLYSDLAACGPGEMMKLRLSDYHDAAIDALLTEYPDAHLRVQGRLHIGITVFPRKHIWVTEWRDQTHLREVLHCSMHLPVYCREVPLLEGQPVVDGGIALGGQHLAHGDETLTISPALWTKLPGERMFDIAMALPPLKCMLPPRTERGIERLFKLGEDATQQWLTSGAKIGGNKRRSWVFKHGGAVVCGGMWGLRAFGEYALPERTRRPPVKRARL